MQPALPFCRGEPYAAYFSRLAQETADAAAALRRLIPHLDAALDGTERLALWQALHRLWQRADAAQREAAAAHLDGRHRAALTALARDWADPALIEHLCRQGTAAARAAFVPALLAHHGLDPLAAPETAAPGLLLPAAQAAVSANARLDNDRIATLRNAALAACEREPALVLQGLALLFELALQARDARTATGVLAELLAHGHAALLPAERVRAWLDGSAFDDDEDRQRPLTLAPHWQRQWLQPGRWLQPGMLADLRAALQRPGPRGRLQELAVLLQQPAIDPRSGPPRREVLQLLAALDRAYELIDRGGDAVPDTLPLLDGQCLAPAAMAALWRGSARWHAERGEAEGRWLALSQARRHQPTPALRQALAAALPGSPELQADWSIEQAHWQRLLDEGDAARSRLAALQLATLWTEGQLEPRPPRRLQDLPRAQGLWQQLADGGEGPLARWAQAALRQPLQTRVRPALQHHAAGEDYLWLESPGAQAVTIVFSCIATHHGFAEVGALAGRLPGQHLLFVRCPDKNWYCDEAFDRVHALLAEQVAARFAPEAVTCWYGSMGGHGALKFALAFGWRAVVFNPQVDLDLWAAFRPRERALLWATQRHRTLQADPAAWARVPLYIACGSASADREALSLLIDQWRQCPRLSLIVEKFDDGHHAGLMQRIAGGPQHAALARISGRLRALQQLKAAEPVAEGDATAAFWQQLDEARACKLEITVRDGRLRWQPSRACTPGLQAAATPSVRPSGVVTGPLPLKRSSAR
jgi:hypothetical protein